MAHFAELDENNVVLRVVVTDNNKPNEGKDWLEERFGGVWVQTSYNTRGGVHYLSDNVTPSEDQGKALRKNYAGIGFIYDPERDAFIEPKPFESWVLNEDTCIWEAPISKPSGLWEWDEDKLEWVEIIL